MKKKITIVGPLPFPVGGVSSHVFRLSSLLSTEGIDCTVLDFYSEEIKNVPKNIKYYSCKYNNKFLRFLWLFFAITFIRSDVVHLHFSTSTGFFAFISAFSPKFSKIFYVTLHHGDLLTKFKSSNFFIQMLSRIALKRMDKIIALSRNQELFYENILASTAKIDRWLSIIPCGLKANENLVPQSIREIKSIQNGGKEVLIMTSGYPSESYRYELCVDLLNYISEELSCILIICLYGKASDPIYDIKLRKFLLNNENVIVVGEMEPDGFLALLKKADLYVRPSCIDSYGLAITDALDLGTPCLASDICNRDPRCELFPVCDEQLFFLKAKNIINKSVSHSGNCIDDFDTSNLKDKIVRCYL